MDKERELYDKFINTLLEKLDSGEIAPKELEIIMKFLDNNNIQAKPDKHSGLNALSKNILPFEDEDELPVKRIK